HPLAIAPGETAGSLHDKLAPLGARAVIAALDELQRTGTLCAEPQPEIGVTYAAKIDKAEARIDWNEEAVAIHPRGRAFNPVPGASTTLGGALLKVWRAHALPEDRAIAAGEPTAPGTCREQGTSLIVHCGRGALVLDEVQPASGRRMSAMEYMKG